MKPEEQLRRARSQSLEQARVRDVSFKAGALVVGLADGRTLSVPLDWFPRLAEGSPKERQRWELDADGAAIWWPELDEGVEVAHLLLGWRSGESEASFRRWRENRKARRAS